MNSRSTVLLAALCAAALAGCSNLSLGPGKKKVVLLDFAEGRVVDVHVTDRLTGSKEMLFVSMPQKSLFLEGYIQGIVTDYEDNPIQGVVVRAVAEGESGEQAGAAFQSAYFDPGVSDTNGTYRIRFSLPIINRNIDIKGKFLYNPGWEQEKVNLGKAYEPQLKQSPFRFLFDEKRGMLIFSEGVRKLVVRSVRSDGPAKNPLPNAKGPPPEEKKAEQKEDDLFKSFGLGNQ
ncbi:MAG: carboxypeptidase regulatory-like domain-containing protein [Elusimicrobia bacterium]|nr:carboxypeptidase regulatory-like domain-containing protein [Elusimicrobiota bacterium]